MILKIGSAFFEGLPVVANPAGKKISKICLQKFGHYQLSRQFDRAPWWLALEQKQKKTENNWRKTKMKSFKNKTWAAFALVAIALIGLSQNAKAVIDLGGYLGPVSINIRNLDNGAIYASTPGGATGAATLDALQTVAATNGQGADTWGIFEITSITGGPNTLFAEQSNNPGNVQLFGLFEATDIGLQTSGTTQTVGSNNLTIKIYSIPTGSALNLGTGPGAISNIPSTNHTALGVFTGITDVGTLELSLTGHAGNFGLNPTIGPNPAGAATELITTFDTGTNIGKGAAFLDVNVADNGIAASNAIFDSNTQIGGSDVQLQFNASQTLQWFTTQTAGQWLVGSSDPGEAAVVAIPEPTSVLAGLACMLPAFGSFLQRRRDNRLGA